MGAGQSPSTAWTSVWLEGDAGVRGMKGVRRRDGEAHQRQALTPRKSHKSARTLCSYEGRTGSRSARSTCSLGISISPLLSQALLRQNDECAYGTRSARKPCALSESPPLPSSPNHYHAKPMTYMADAACDNLDEGLARPGRLDGDLSHVKAVPVVVRHTCQHGGRQRMGGSSGRSHFVVGVSRSRQHGRRATRRGSHCGLCAVERRGE